MLVRCAMNEIVEDGNFLTCPRPRPPENAIITQVVASSSATSDFLDYQEHDKVYFQCKDGFSHFELSSVMYVTCGSNGKWFPPINILGKCIQDEQISQCREGFFRCRKSRNCIEKHKKCNCEQDCEDGSDEEDCSERRRYYFASSRGKDSNGVITSPDFPRSYPSNFSCTYLFHTMKDHRIELFFEEFSLPNKSSGECMDHVTINGQHSKYNTQRFGDKVCGNDLYFKFVYSNKTRLTIKVELGNANRKLKDKSPKGYSLIWRVHTKEYVKNRVAERLGKKFFTVNETILNSESMYTIFTPIAITALLPLFLIIFLCFHRKAKNHKKREANKKREAKEGNIPIEKSTNNDKQFLNAEHLEKKYKDFVFNKTNGSLYNSFMGNHIKNSELINAQREHCHLPQHEFIKQSFNNSNTRSNSEISSDDMRYVKSYDLQVNHDHLMKITPQCNFSALSSTDSLNKSTHCWCNQNPPTRLLPVGQEYPKYGELHLDFRLMLRDYELSNKCCSINYPMENDENIELSELYSRYSSHKCEKQNLNDVKNNSDYSSEFLDYKNRQKEFHMDSDVDLLAYNLSDSNNLNNLIWSRRTLCCDARLYND